MSEKIIFIKYYMFKADKNNVLQHNIYNYTIDGGKNVTDKSSKSKNKKNI